MPVGVLQLHLQGTESSRFTQRSEGMQSIHCCVAGVQVPICQQLAHLADKQLLFREVVTRPNKFDCLLAHTAALIPETLHSKMNDMCVRSSGERGQELQSSYTHLPAFMMNVCNHSADCQGITWLGYGWYHLLSNMTEEKVLFAKTYRQSLHQKLTSLQQLRIPVPLECPHFRIPEDLPPVRDRLNCKHCSLPYCLTSVFEQCSHIPKSFSMFFLPRFPGIMLTLDHPKEGLHCVSP
mmetsp:Transcript_86921/g.163950  ORF Transcript_86921/g.163950 Transcript_86921/m.163950 type:complete len:237 (-) Transcript_86921:61-771(-)